MLHRQKQSVRSILLATKYNTSREQPLNLSLQDFNTPRFNIMVSSVVRSLELERRAIKEALEATCPHFRVWLSEDWTSDSHSSKETCTTFARDCQFFILLLGKHYGNPPRGRGVSVTEMEFNAALAANRPKVRAYLKRERHVDPKQAKFIQRVRNFKSGLQCPTFDTLDQLTKYVVADTITFYGNREGQISSPSLQPTFPANNGQSLLARTRDPGSTQAQSSTFIERQRRYIDTSIRNNTASKLAKTLIVELTPDERRCLAIISTGNILARRDYLRKLLPEENWYGFIERTQRRGLLMSKERSLQVAPNVREQLPQDKALIREAHERWLSVLAPKAGFSDLALALCIHLIQIKKFSEAVERAHLMILSMEDRVLAKFFYDLLAHLRTKRIYRKITPRSRILLFDALGIFRSHEGDFPDAIKLFNSSS